MRKPRKPKRRKAPAKSWEIYEQVAQYLLNQFAEHFKLGRVEGKQILLEKSGISWEIDAKGLEADKKGFVVVECRRYKSRLNKKDTASLAWTILKTEARGGIIVSPFDLQSGAKKVAASANVQHVTLDPNSTTTDYLMRFVEQVFLGRSATVRLTPSIDAKAMRGEKVIGERKG